MLRTLKNKSLLTKHFPRHFIHLSMCYIKGDIANLSKMCFFGAILAAILDLSVIMVIKDIFNSENEFVCSKA